VDWAQSPVHSRDVVSVAADLRSRPRAARIRLLADSKEQAEHEPDQERNGRKD